MELKSLGKRIKVMVGDSWIYGELCERTDTTAILPQFFAKLDDGEARDLRNDCYAVVDPDEDPSCSDT